MPTRSSAPPWPNDVADYLGVERGIVLDQFRKAAAGPARDDRRRRARQPVPAMERILLNAILDSDEVRPRDSAAAHRRLRRCERFVTRGIFETLIALQEAGQGIGLRRDRSAAGGIATGTLLAAVLFADEAE